MVLVYSAGAETSPMQTLAKQTREFFIPVKGKITTLISPSEAIINRGLKEGIHKAMRLKVLKPGVPFRHPVTGEIVGTTDEPVGLVEVIQVSTHEARVRLIEGYMDQGFKVATQTETFRVLFHQDRGVDYYWADRYHKNLSKIPNIALVDAPIEDYSMDQLFKLADQKRADLILTLSGHIAKAFMVITQRLLWADGVMIMAKTVRVPLEEIRKLQVASGQEILTMDKPLLIFTLPMDARMMTFGDFDGDRKRDIAVATDSEIFIYGLSPAELEEEGKIELPSTGGLLWLDSIDIDGDSNDELLYTYFDENRKKPVSFIVKITLLQQEETLIEKLWQREGFLRVFNGKILYQEYSDKKIWGSKIYTLKMSNGQFISQETSLPELVGSRDLYSFTTISDGRGTPYYLVVDDRALLRLYDTKGNLVSLSDINLGGFDRSVKFYEDPFTEEARYWYIKDRSISLGTQVLVIKRVAVSTVAPGLGYKSSNLLSVWVENDRLKASSLLEELSGSIRDFHIEGEKLYILQSPVLGFSLKSLFSGRGLNATKLLVYQKRLR